jgi:hypothetical protein
MEMGTISKQMVLYLARKSGITFKDLKDASQDDGLPFSKDSFYRAKEKPKKRKQDPFSSSISPERQILIQDFCKALKILVFISIEPLLLEEN